MNLTTCRCDKIRLDGTRRPADEPRATYRTGQKMRASMTYAFGHTHGLGSMHWQRSQVDGHMVGNPSVSEAVSTYMMSLRRRKVRSIWFFALRNNDREALVQVRAGETPTSARAVSAVGLIHFANDRGLPELGPTAAGNPGKDVSLQPQARKLGHEGLHPRHKEDQGRQPLGWRPCTTPAWIGVHVGVHVPPSC